MSPIPATESSRFDPIATPLTPGERLLLGEMVDGVVASIGADKLLRILVFGSRARAEGHEDSDLDIAVLVPGRPTPGARRALAELAASVQEGREDLPPLRPILIGNQETTNPALLRAIERDGILLWAKKNG